MEEPERPRLTSARNLVSVAVPAYNNEDTIERCVQSLATQSYGPVEVIVIDDGSIDATPEKVRELMKVMANVRMLRTDHFGPSHARNVGTRESTGDFVLFADADAVYSSDYLEKAMKIMSADPGVGAVCVTGTIWIKKSTFVSRGIALEYEMKQKFLRSGKWGPYFAFLYRRDSIEHVGGFDEELFQSEDKDLFERVKSAGYKIGLVDGFNWSHLYPQDVRSLISRSYRAGKQRVIYVFKKKMYGELFKRTAGLWAIVVMLFVSLLVPYGVPAVVLLLGAAYCYRAARVMTQGWGKGKLIDMLLLPSVSVLRYLSSAVGYVKGSVVYATRKIRGLRTSWSDL